MFGSGCNRPRPAREEPRRGRFVPRIESLEDRMTPAGLFLAGVGGVVGADDPEAWVHAGVGVGNNRVLNDLKIEAFGGTAGDCRVALGDVNADGTDDIILASGFGGTGEVAIFDGADALQGNPTEIARFVAYRDFTGGAFVASGDLNGDGFDEVITTPGLGGRGHLKVFNFNDSGNFGGTPTLITSAYTFTDYNGEVRVATLNSGTETLVVTASGAGVAADIRLWHDVHQIGGVPDKTAVDRAFLAARLVPFNGYTGGVSVAAGDTDGDGDDELFVSKNTGAARVAVYDLPIVIKAFQAGNPKAAALATFEVFAGFSGEVRLGAADTDGDGRVEVLVTTGASGDTKGTPVKAFERSVIGNRFGQMRSFYTHSEYSGGAWLSGKDMQLGRDVTSFVILDDVATDLPATFGDGEGTVNGILEGGEVAVQFPHAGEWSEDVTGGNLAFRDMEVSFSFDHPIADETVVSLLYTSAEGETTRLVLFDGTDVERDEKFTGLDVTFSDRAASLVTAGKAGQRLVGTFRADGGSLAEFVASLPDQTGTFAILFEDSVVGDSGQVTATVTPSIRMRY
jgi:hypothetical protein